VSVNTRAVFERIRDQLVLQHFAGVSRTQLKGATPRPLYPDEITQSVSCTWQDEARHAGIPEEYWETADLPRFCKQSADEWWDWFWSHILQEKNVLLPGRDPSKVQTQIRDYFLALVDARENETF
jgi:hypothetical protein